MSFAFVLATACEKEDPGPSQADLDRCAHIDREQDGIGEFLYQTCLNNPWPTELPPATQEGRGVVACWINDTLAFVSGDPREPASNTAYARPAPLDGRTHIVSYKGTYSIIDSVRITLDFDYDNDYNLININDNSYIRIQRHRQLAGFYTLLPSNSNLSITENSQEIYGLFDMKFLRTSPPYDTLYLTSGRFDVRRK